MAAKKKAEPIFKSFDHLVKWATWTIIESTINGKLKDGVYTVMLQAMRDNVIDKQGEFQLGHFDEQMVDNSIRIAREEWSKPSGTFDSAMRVLRVQLLLHNMKKM